MPSKLYRLDDQKRKSERLLLYAAFGALVGGLIGVIPLVLWKISGLWLWFACVGSGFTIGVTVAAQFRIKSYVYFLFGIFFGGVIGMILFLLTMWQFWVLLFLGAGYFVGLLLGVYEAKKEEEAS
ncbi:MAG: hypothetical protein ACFFCZ_06940 [Promethearchaeota archaeon]